MRVLRTKASTFANRTKPTRRPKFAKELAFRHAEKNFIFFPALRCFNFFPTTQPTTDKTMDKIYYRPNDTDEKAHTANKVLPQWGLTCFYETFVGKRTAVLLLNISAKNSPLRQYPNRYQPF